MILVTVGSSKFNFDRLLKIIDKLCEKNIINGKDVIAQIGYTDYVPKNYKYFISVPSDEFKKYIDESDYIISHAGVGTIIKAVQKGKKVIVFPRRKKYNEHVDDHQMQIKKTLEDNGYVLSANNFNELVNNIKMIKSFKPKKYKSNNKKINKIIIDYIEGID